MGESKHRAADSATSGDFASIMRWSAFAVAVCVVAVIICYYFVDRSVARFVYDRKTAKLDGLKWLTEPPPLAQSWSPLVLTVLAVRRAFGPWKRWQLALFLACASVIVADQFRESMGDLFGRYWPETWHNNNPSFIGTGAYGFHPFEVGDDIGSFPSGHSARILAFASVFWIAMPRGRWLCVVIAVPMLVALVGMNYHFVGDVIAGSVVGGIVGAWAARLANLRSDGVLAN
jgi:membrane-associated phospholipid phosphatase